MELKVWVEGIQRIVCGVTVNTTCQDVVFALAHATGKIGRFTLIERWRNNERLLAPNENPLKLLLKWGEYANDVQFILQRCENKQQSLHSIVQSEKDVQANFKNSNENRNNQMQTVMTKKPLGLSNSNNKNLSNKINSNQTLNNHHIAGIVSNNNNNQSSETNAIPQKTEIKRNDINFMAATERTKELRKSFGVSEKQSENVGVVKGIPQSQNQNKFHSMNNTVTNSIAKYSPSDNNVIVKSIPTSFQPNAISPNPRHEKSHSNPIEMPSSNIRNESYRSELAKNAYNDKNSINTLYSQIGVYNSKSTNELNLGDGKEESLDSKSLSVNIISTRSNSASTLTNRNCDQLLGSLPLGENTSSVENYVKNYNASEINNNTNNNYNDSNSENDSSLGIDYYSNGNNTINFKSESIMSNETNFNSETNSIENNLVNIYNITMKTESSDIIPIISSNGALVPPPYRNPPPPRRSPMNHLQNESVLGNHSPTSAVKTMSNSISSSNEENQVGVKTFINDVNGNCKEDAQICQDKPLMSNNNVEDTDILFQATQYKDLIQLIKYQREKISTQQMDLKKVDSEIIYLENKDHEQAQELELISKDISKVDKMFRLGSEQLQTLQYVEEENELVKQQEKTLKSEIMLLRSKLVNCETELLQCRNKIRLLMDDIEIEKRAMSQKQKQNKQLIEKDFVIEMERIRSEIDAALSHTETSSKTTENLKREIFLIEQAIAEKKCQLEKLVNEMKEANLQSLQVVTSEEIKNLLEGPQKQGSSRRIIGSPRQLENAVATSKNPHGVWV